MKTLDVIAASQRSSQLFSVKQEKHSQIKFLAQTKLYRISSICSIGQI